MFRSLFNHCPYFPLPFRMKFPNKLSTTAVYKFFTFYFFSHLHSVLSLPSTLLKLLMPSSPLQNLVNTFKSQINTQKSLKWLPFKNDSFLMSSKTTLSLCLPFLFMDSLYQSSMLPLIPEYGQFSEFCQRPSFGLQSDLIHVNIFLIRLYSGNVSPFLSYRNDQPHHNGYFHLNICKRLRFRIFKIYAS